MPLYSHVCTSCGHIMTSEYDRGKAPKVIGCSKCGGEMKRSVATSGSIVERDITEEPTATEKLRHNISKTDNQLDSIDNKITSDGVKKWRKELTGGAY